MNQPLVSIIVPAYNAEKHIGPAIDSVLKQTYSNWEMITTDDGSTDGTAKIIKEYVAKDKRITYQYQQNQRMASARNAGIKIAKGKYVAFLDADNLFLPEKLERQVTYLEAHPECGVCYSKIYHFFEPDAEKLYKNKNEQPLYQPDQFRELLWRNPINVLSVLIRKELFDKYGAFKQGWPACDEHYVWINLALNSVKFDYLNEPVGLLRLHQSNDSKRKDHLFDTALKFLELLDIVEDSLSPAKRKPYQEDFRQLRNQWKTKLIIGKLLKYSVTSWLLMPLYLRRFNEAFVPIQKNFHE